MSTVGGASAVAMFLNQFLSRTVRAFRALSMESARNSHEEERNEWDGPTCCSSVRFSLLLLLPREVCESSRDMAAVPCSLGSAMDLGGMQVSNEWL